MKVMLVVCLAAAVAFASAPASAQTWNEQGDAGDLPGSHQVPQGAGPLTTINGNNGASDADMYCINIPNPQVFQASTCGVTGFDTQLFLFDQGGIGITHDDDDPAGCGLQSTITGVFVPAPGDYLIAITRYNRDPVNPGGALIWANMPFNVERQPDGPGAPGPVAAWTGTPAAGGAYTIRLTGVNYCGVTAVESTTWGQIKSIYSR